MERGRSYLQPFFDLNPIRSNVTMVAWNRISNALYFGAPSTACLENLYLNVAGQGLRQTDVATYESFLADFTNFYRQHPEIRGSFVSQRFPNQAVLRVPDDETAYPYRDIKTHLYVPPSTPLSLFFFYPSNPASVFPHHQHLFLTRLQNSPTDYSKTFTRKTPVWMGPSKPS